MSNYNIEVTNKYSNVLTLLTINKDMRNMTVEEFTQFMKDAVASAQAEYSKIMDEVNDRDEKRMRELNAERLWKLWDAKLKSYKRESARKKKITEIQKEIDNYKYFKDSAGIFFDIMPMLNNDNITHSYACLTTNTSDKDYSFDYKDYLKYIEMSDGVVFKYYINGTDPIQSYSFRPWVEFIISEDVMKKLKEEHEKWSMKVSKFYDSLNYKGD